MHPKTTINPSMRPAEKLEGPEQTGPQTVTRVMIIHLIKMKAMNHQLL